MARDPKDSSTLDLPGIEAEPMFFAERKAEECRAELQEVNEQIRELQKRKKQLQKYLTQHSKMQLRVCYQHDRRRTLKAMILNTVAEFLADGQPRRTRDLVKRLEQRKVMISGRDKIQVVSALLCESSHFTSDRKQGWTLVTKTKAGRTRRAAPHHRTETGDSTHAI